MKKATHKGAGGYLAALWRRLNGQDGRHEAHLRLRTLGSAQATGGSTISVPDTLPRASAPC